MVVTSEDVTMRIKKNVLSWFGQIEQMSEENMAKQICDGKVRDRARHRLTLENKDTGGRLRKKHKDARNVCRERGMQKRCGRLTLRSL